MAQTDTLLFNPLDPAFRADPYPAYARLREEAPAYRVPNGTWVISRYADCLALLRDPRASSDARNSSAYQRALQRGSVDFSDDVLGETPPFLVLDPPDHTRLRRLVSKAFTPKMVEQLRPRIQEHVDLLLDTALAKGDADVIDELAYPLPLTVICELLGVPSEDHDAFRSWSRNLSRGLDPPEVLTPDVIDARKRAGNEFAAYFHELVAKRPSSPSDDLLSALIAAEEAGDRLSEDELVSTCILLLAAGHETTVNLIGNGMLALLRHPDQLAALRRNPSLASYAVEEVLRYDAPVQFAFRTAKEDMEVAGATIGAGDQIVLLLASANRDPERLQDPDVFEIARRDSRHLAFGSGIHFCLGAPLARLEGEVVFNAIARQTRDIRLRTDVPEYREHIVNRGLRTLPVTLHGR